MNGNIRTVAILGGGPAACTLAIMLARGGVKSVIYHLPRRAPLIVGESLVPAIIPMLRTLDVEDEVKSYSKLKPGATINISPEHNFFFFFSNLAGGLPKYAYNVPRDKFDDTLLNAARKAGVKIVEAAASVEKVSGTDKVKLGDEAIAAAKEIFNGQQPDLIVDATGRVRLLPKLMGIQAAEGGRKDTALFAHVDQSGIDNDGHVHSTRLDHGWSWRIPLPDRMSLGIVIGSEHLPKFGATKEEQYDNLLKQDSVLNKFAADSKRLTPVMEYKNYQLVSEKMYGDNWALVGDTAGFIDPVFSSGLLIGMQGGMLLAKAILKGTPKAFAHYQKQCAHHLQCWHEIADYFYDGKLFNSFLVGETLKKNNFMLRIWMPYFQARFAGIFTGAASNNNFYIGMMRWIVNWSVDKGDPEMMRVH
ncbi:MAG TPA: NAD(P)/FAD-dependent oxidoreductase [Candidatus Sulfotelmatobacter sp.]|nr:NAD(P)/FAD-dependent oxidoreductase [Candidatus Sulfotelmatobacter sp.]